MLLSQSEARAITDKVLSYVRADEAEVTLSGTLQGNLRFARNIPTTSGQSSGVDLRVTCVFGKRVGSYSTSQIDDRSLEAAVRHAEELAKLSPETPEYMPCLGPQTYVPSAQWDDATSKLSPGARAMVAASAIDEARAKDLMAAGYYENVAGFNARANSRGLFAYHPYTAASYSLTVRTADGSGSGWAAADSFRAGAIDGRRLTERAIEKAIRSQKPTSIEPGTYTVVLEPSPAGDMLRLFQWGLDRRGADEGRSFFSDPEHGTKIGQKLFGDNVTIYSDPTHALAPSAPWGEDGLPIGRTMWVERGVQRNLAVRRYWAAQKGIDPLPWGSNLIMEGENHSLDDLIAATDHGLLITSFWYIRQVDPKTMLFTGLTRDGVFMIEKGKITRPVINLRWNESPAAIFKNIEMLSHAGRVVTREGDNPLVAPAMKVKEFRFTSVSTST